MYWRLRRLRSQNFLVNRELARQLIRGSSIALGDTVLEIGAGTGIITQELVKAAKDIVAFEIDQGLISHLHRRFKGMNNLKLVKDDFLCSPLPQKPYKVFANIPFSITGEIFRKLLQSPHSPSDCYLVVQAEAASKFIARPQSNTLAAMLYYPWWNIHILHRFQPSDFVPSPKVGCVLLHLQPRSTPLIPPSQKAAYLDFITYHFIHHRFAKFVPPSK
jgi:16S rRNA (adenine1518-N6/adenine1519-N6)-dimethyltransferase